MNISIDGHLSIKTDENNFILQEIKFKTNESKDSGDAYYSTVGYYGSLSGALKGYLKYAIKKADYGGQEITTIQELITKINSIENKIDKTLEDIKIKKEKEK